MIIVSIIVFIIILGLLVVVHELGHFFAAKWFGVEVEEFGVGYPPRLFGRIWRGTLYSINWIPIGGFVKIKGVVGGDQMDSPTTGALPSAGHFLNKPRWQRFIILSAGIVMNLVLAAVILSIGYMIGLPSATSSVPEQAIVTDQHIIVADIQAGVPAATEGLQVGDVIESIAGQTINHPSDVQTILHQQTAGTPVSVVVKRDQAVMTEFDLTTITLPDNQQTGLGVYFIETGLVRLPPQWAIVYGSQQTVQLTIGIFQSLASLLQQWIQHQPIAGSLAGPVGIASLSHQATTLGLPYVLQFAAILSINLAIFNLLPIPALDGGRILFLLYEIIVRRPLNQKIEAVIHNIGFIILLLLVLLVTIRDIFNLF